MTGSDSRPPTLEQVANYAGVSRATVSRVINNVQTVDPELRRTVERPTRAELIARIASRRPVKVRPRPAVLIRAERDRR